MEYNFTKEQYLEAKAIWKSLETKTAFDHLVYNIIRGKDPKTGFTPVSNPNKLQYSCNHNPYHYFILLTQFLYQRARPTYHWHGIEITKEVLKKVLP